MHTPATRAHALRAIVVTYPGSIAHVSAVRADLCALLHDCPRANDVIICASELAANAALHSHSPTCNKDAGAESGRSSKLSRSPFRLMACGPSSRELCGRYSGGNVAPYFQDYSSKINRSARSLLFAVSQSSGREKNAPNALRQTSIARSAASQTWREFTSSP